MPETTGLVGGPRHYEGPTLGTVGVWKCPACGTENSGPLEDGCGSCGSGTQKARHVGVPPRSPSPVAGRRYNEAPLALDINDATAHAFGQWMAPHRGQYSEQVERVLFEAWQAAIRWYQETLKTEMVETPAPDPVVAVPKPLILKVIETLERTTDLPEEQQSEALLGLIAQLKELVE